MVKKKSCVLLTAINSSPALNVIHYLKKQHKYDVTIIGCDITEHTAGRLFVDKFYKIPHFDSVSLLPNLLKICRREQVDIIIPVFEPELLILSENREKFLPTSILIPNKDTVNLCMDKEKTLKFFIDNNIPTCNIHQPNHLTKKDFPLFLKPKVGNASKGIKVIHNKKELQSTYCPKRDLLCSLLQGDEFTIDIYCAKAGVIDCILARKRIETTDGMATRAITYNNKKLFDYCRKAMSLLDYQGVCCMQCIYDQDFKFFEINPRFGGSTNLTLEAGYNIPLYILDTLHNRKIQLPKKLKKLYMVKFYNNAYWET
jgi:carbamoyl-phosphate synthase large subunit